MCKPVKFTAIFPLNSCFSLIYTAILYFARQYDVYILAEYKDELYPASRGFEKPSKSFCICVKYLSVNISLIAVTYKEV